VQQGKQIHDMLKVSNGKRIKFRFGFMNSGFFFDPLSQSPATDVYAAITRGNGGSGNIVHSTTSLINSSYRITSITLNSHVSNVVLAKFTFDINHKFNIGETVVIYGVGGGYDSEYTITSIPTSNQIIATMQFVGSLTLSGFNSSLHKARATLKNNFYFNRFSNSEYQFIYTIPNELFSGVYTLSLQTTINGREEIIEHIFEVSAQEPIRTGFLTHKKYLNGKITFTTDYDHGLKVGDLISIRELDQYVNGDYYISEIPSDNQFSFPLNTATPQGEFNIAVAYSSNQITGTSGELVGPSRGTSLSRRPIYDSLELYSTNSILLLGHCDGLELNTITRINSLQEAVNVLSADMNSPLLRGVYDAYSCGARNIYVAAVAPMSEYVDDVAKRLTSMDNLTSAQNGSRLNFYQKYYERLEDSYEIMKGYELIDIIVPLETSIIETGSIDFIRQLAVHCYNFNETTGFVQIGIISSRSNGIKDADISVLEAKSIFKDKLTTYDLSGQIESDIGRYIIPVYGELTFNHLGFNRAYTSTAAAAFAGTMSSNPVYNGMIRKNIPGAYSIFGSSLSKDSLVRLDNLGINTIYRSRKGTKGLPFEIYVTNDYTLANKTSSFIKTPQIRLAAMVINEIKGIANDGLGKSSEDKITAKVKRMLDILVNSKIIKHYSLQSYGSKTERGFLIFEITLVSCLGLKNINFSVTTGPGV